jgi:hypothetical protein
MNTQPTAAYQRALLGAAAALIGVLLLYAGLVLSIVGLTVWHGMAHTAFFARGGTEALLYATPLFLGIVVTLFLIRPIFASRPPPPPSQAITLEEHPRLFQFIGAICQEVGCQPPSRVEVNCDVNASVRFRQGWASLSEGDLALTIGLPLVAGLPARHLGGIIAHEFGHFRQEAGLRLTFVVRSISAWLWRIVHGRDQLDESLKESAKDSHVIIAIPLYLGHLGITLTRHLLRFLMLMGNAACCRLLRQMEFDADQHEIRIAGSQAFSETNVRIRALNAAWQGSQGLLARAWREHRLPDDLPAYIVHLADALPEATREAIEEAARSARTGTFDTHPSDAEREAAAIAADLPGTLELPGPAAALFEEFPALCREVTRWHYAGILGHEPESTRMESTESASAATDNEIAGHRVATFYAPGSGPYQLTATWPELDPATPVAVADLHATIASARVTIDAEAEGAGEWLRSWQQALLTERRVQMAHALNAATIRWDPAELGLPSKDNETIDLLADRSAAERQSAEALLRALSEIVGQRIHAALLLWWHDPMVTTDCPELPAVQDEIRSLHPVVRTVAASAQTLHALEGLHVAFHAMLSATDRCRDQESTQHQLDHLAAQLRGQVRTLLPSLAGVRHPYLSQPGAPLTVREAVLRESTVDDGFRGAYAEAAAVRQLVPDLHSRALARLIALAYEAERRARIGG